MTDNPETRKVSIICARGSLEDVYATLVLANGARMEGMESQVFFTFFGLDAIHPKRMRRLHTATVGNPSLTMPGGLPFPSLLGMLPGVEAGVSAMMRRRMEKLDIPPVDEFLDIFKASGGRIYACRMAMDMFGYTAKDLWDGVDGVLTVGEFYEKSQGAQIIFT